VESIYPNVQRKAILKMNLMHVIMHQVRIIMYSYREAARELSQPPYGKSFAPSRFPFNAPENLPNLAILVKTKIFANSKLYLSIHIRDGYGHVFGHPIVY
jgi:hypothetical protein